MIFKFYIYILIGIILLAGTNAETCLCCGDDDDRPKSCTGCYMIYIQIFVFPWHLTIKVKIIYRSEDLSKCV